MRPILGIDFGRARIGVAISDELRLLAHPVETIPSSKQAIRRVAALAREKDAERIVVGVPKLMSGSLGSAAEEVLRFIEELRQVVSSQVVAWDERLTTVAAHRALRDAGKKTKNTRGYVDQVAAQMILQGYLDSLQSPVDPSEAHQ
ncbi:MAG TPA: Holliday junction resolvase RuvX [Chthoniobacterales bacterium]|nr:Holliday junction resolvase RuvX [Chthoniobacterales bacterium]